MKRKVYVEVEAFGKSALEELIPSIAILVASEDFILYKDLVYAVKPNEVTEEKIVFHPPLTSEESVQRLHQKQLVHSINDSHFI